MQAWVRFALQCFSFALGMCDVTLLAFLSGQVFITDIWQRLRPIPFPDTHTFSGTYKGETLATKQQIVMRKNPSCTHMLWMSLTVFSQGKEGGFVVRNSSRENMYTLSIWWEFVVRGRSCVMNVFTWLCPLEMSWHGVTSCELMCRPLYHSSLSLSFHLSPSLPLLCLPLPYLPSLSFPLLPSLSFPPLPSLSFPPSPPPSVLLPLLPSHSLQPWEPGEALSHQTGRGSEVLHLRETSLCHHQRPHRLPQAQWRRYMCTSHYRRAWSWNQTLYREEEGSGHAPTYKLFPCWNVDLTNENRWLYIMSWKWVFLQAFSIDDD